MDPIIITLIQIGLWIACAVIGAKLMEQKSRSPVIGAILGILFGLIGLVIILFIPQKKIVIDETKVIDVESKEVEDV